MRLLGHFKPENLPKIWSPCYSKGGHFKMMATHSLNLFGDIFGRAQAGSRQNFKQIFAKMILLENFKAPFLSLKTN